MVVWLAAVSGIARAFFQPEANRRRHRREDKLKLLDPYLVDMATGWAEDQQMPVMLLAWGDGSVDWEAAR